MPLSGSVLVSARSEDHEEIVGPILKLAKEGFQIFATVGTANVLRASGIEVTTINKAQEGSPHTVDLIEAGSVDLVINTVDHDPDSRRDSFEMRRKALQRSIPYCTTLAAAKASADAIVALRQQAIGVRSLQEIHARIESR